MPVISLLVIGAVPLGEVTCASSPSLCSSAMLTGAYSSLSIASSRCSAICKQLGRPPRRGRAAADLHGEDLRAVVIAGDGGVRLAVVVVAGDGRRADPWAHETGPRGPYVECGRRPARGGPTSAEAPAGAEISVAPPARPRRVRRARRSAADDDR